MNEIRVKRNCNWCWNAFGVFAFVMGGYAFSIATELPRQDSAHRGSMQMMGQLHRDYFAARMTEAEFEAYKAEVEALASKYDAYPEFRGLRWFSGQLRERQNAH